MAVPAFPGAEGGGATATGGRGGRTIIVTNTNATGNGSLYAALMETGKRTIVFQTSGIIDWSSIANEESNDGLVKIKNGDLTVAGQTSPGYGIVIKKGQLLLEANNIIIRYITVRPGYDVERRRAWGIATMYGGNHILDHVSISWANDDSVGIWNYGTGNLEANDITLQNSIIAEGLYPSGNVWGGSKAIIIGSDDNQYFGNVSIHHNLISHFNERMPLLKNEKSEVINNLINNGYNVTSMTWGGGRFDFINNVYKRASVSGRTEIGADQNHLNPNSSEYPDQGLPGDPSIYVSGNKGWTQSNPMGEQWIMVSHDPYGVKVPASPTWRRSTPNPPYLYPITIIPTLNLESSLLHHVGNSRYIDGNGNWINRNDKVDTRIINDYLNGTGGLVTDHNNVGGYPTYYKVNPYTDSDNDGISDVWAAANGINSSNPATKIAANGYSNLENFINGKEKIVPLKWKCSGAPNYTCTEDVSGTFASLEDCRAGCKEGAILKWTCSGHPNYDCTQSVDGIHDTEEQCKEACKTVTMGWGELALKVGILIGALALVKQYLEKQK